MSARSDASPEIPDFAGLSLYLKLKPGAAADLEVVALASINWASALRAAAHQIDPSSDLRLLLLDADEGSLKLNVILDWAESQAARFDVGSTRHFRLKSIALGITMFMTGTVSAFYINDWLDDPEFSSEEKAFIEETINEALKSPDLQDPRKRFFQALERDRNIEGVSVMEPGPGIPKVIIPSSEFAERAGLWELQVEPPYSRRQFPLAEVTLISPVLLQAHRRWKFRDETRGEFGALMRDEVFLAALDQDHIRERLRTGIKMTVRLAVIEDYLAGRWVERPNRTVVEVIYPRPE